MPQVRSTPTFPRTWRRSWPTAISSPASWPSSRSSASGCAFPLESRSSGSFCVVGIVDLAVATQKAVAAEMYRYSMGWNWYILTFYVPMLVVTHAMILYYLVAARRRGD
jgi:hypothetical protein